MRKFVDIFTRRSRRVAPTQWAGETGAVTYGGYVDENELNSELASPEQRHRRYMQILANTAIVAASVRYFLNLIGKAEWAFEPAEGDANGEYVEKLEQALLEDPRTPWHRIVRRMAMYRFHGFSVQEWRVRRHVEGWLTFDDVKNRPQSSVEQWDIEPGSGDLLGIVQRKPRTQEYVYIPRGKIIYVVDDSLTDTPTGMGVFRHLVVLADRLKRYEQLEGYGYEVDLRNVPVIKAPLGKLNQAMEAGQLDKAGFNKIINPLKRILKSHVKTPSLGLLLDSAVYEDRGDAQRPTSTPMYSMELLAGAQTSLAEIAEAIERINREMARILGTEQLLLGSDSVGSHALSQDKTKQFYLMIDSVLMDIKEAVKADLVDVLWVLNGWPDDMKPDVRTEMIRGQDVDVIASVLKELAAAGATLQPDDPVINQIRDLLGLERQDEDLIQRMLDDMQAELNPPEPNIPDDGGNE